MSVVDVLFIFGCGVLYRWGGGKLPFLPGPFSKGWKAARRFGIPLILIAYVGFDLEMIPGVLLLSVILHFNLDEIEERDWDDVATYGFAQSFALHPAGWLAAAPGVWWIIGVLWSNIGIKGHRLGWHWVEFIHGLMIGTVGLGYVHGWIV